MNNYFSHNKGNQVENKNLHFNYLYDENGQYNLSNEVIPYVQKLIKLCEEHGFFIKIFNRTAVVRKSLINDLSFDMTAAYEAIEDVDFCNQNFGLAFGIGIYECSASGHLKYLDHRLFYEKVGRLGESIGLKWASNQKLLKNLRYFELRPKWAQDMSDKEMIHELNRRKQANLSLLT